MAAGFLVFDGTPVHLDEMACRGQGLTDAGDIGQDGLVGQRKGKKAMWWSGLLASQVEFALQVSLGDLNITQSHADIFVPQQLHESRQTDAQAEHLGGIAVPAMLHEA